MGLFDFIKSIFVKTPPPEEPQAAEPAVPAPAAPEPKPAPPPCHWDGDMVPRVTGPGKSVEHSGGGYLCCPTVRLEWVSRQTDGEGNPLRTRTPETHTETMPRRAFTAAGKTYRAPHQLVYSWEGSRGSWAWDMYGRPVLMATERFPCFDSSDYLYEDRYFRWFLLCEGGKLTCVSYTDGTDTVTVTEDVLDLEIPCWKEMGEGKCFGNDSTRSE